MKSYGRQDIRDCLMLKHRRIFQIVISDLTLLDPHFLPRKHSFYRATPKASRTTRGTHHRFSTPHRVESNVKVNQQVDFPTYVSTLNKK